MKIPIFYFHLSPKKEKTYTTCDGNRIGLVIIHNLF